jgi:hypothetical protein
MVEVVTRGHEEVKHKKEHHMSEDLRILNNDVLDGLDTLQEACVPLYKGAHCTKLVATMTLMNMWVHSQ